MPLPIEYFKETDSRTGEQVGPEVETLFVDRDTRLPIVSARRAAIMATALAADDRPDGAELQTETGCHNIELSVPPGTFDTIGDSTLQALEWLYRAAAKHGVEPVFAPTTGSTRRLLDVSTSDRDRLWAVIDGEGALDLLSDCASVQFTVDVSREDAIRLINQLWASGYHRANYEFNDGRWAEYIHTSRAPYRADRYAGPHRFADLGDYVRRHQQHAVVMHNDLSVWLMPAHLSDFDIDLYLRSVWWHFRLRRYGRKLVIEIRPRARGTDKNILEQIEELKQIFSY
jgi:hypothetical protein